MLTTSAATAALGRGDDTKKQAQIQPQHRDSAKRTRPGSTTTNTTTQTTMTEHHPPPPPHPLLLAGEYKKGKVTKQRTKNS